jgi:hypothetical protein
MEHFTTKPTKITKNPDICSVVFFVYFVFFVVEFESFNPSGWTEIWLWAAEEVVIFPV